MYYPAKADVFCDLRLEELKEIADAAMITTCQTGRIFDSPNEHGEVLFILKKGQVQLYRITLAALLRLAVRQARNHWF